MIERGPLERTNITAETLRVEMERTGTSLLQAVVGVLLETKVREKFKVEGHTVTVTPDNFHLLPRMMSYIVPFVMLIATVDYIATGELRLQRLFPEKLIQKFMPDYLSPVNAATSILSDERDAVLLREDPSGFLLLDRLTKGLTKEQQLTNELMRSQWDVTVEEMRQARDDYREFYLIGARAGLGPMPKSIPEGENSSNFDIK